MKRLSVVVALIALSATYVDQCSSWEFALEGNWLWGYEYFAQQGRAGFFGAFDSASPALSAGNLPHFRAYNCWEGDRSINGIQYGMVTAADASVQWTRLELRPELRVNQALRLRGSLEIGDRDYRGYGLYVNSSGFGSYTGMAFVKANEIWMSVQTPWGIVVAGKRPFQWGLGAQYDGSVATSETIGMVVPSGPFRLGLFLYPTLEGIWVQWYRDVISSTAVTPLAGTGLQPPSSRALNDRNWDKSLLRNYHPAFFFTYSSGPLEIGLVYEFFQAHHSPALAWRNEDANQTATFDGTLEDGSTFLKYHDGTFFFNAELAWVRGQTTKQPPLVSGRSGIPPVYPSDGGGSFYAPSYLESWKFLTELGFIRGPLKVGFLYSWVPGPDRRHGIWIDRQSWENIVGGAFMGNPKAFLPYSLLMGYQYGAGLNADTGGGPGFTGFGTGEGFMTDASSVGARIDYALASNLNIYGSYFHSTRVSDGWGWGSLSLDENRNVVLLGGFVQPRASSGMNGGPNNFTNPAPSIPDHFLGWEVTAGLDWKLLENWILSTRVACWQPGGWFKYACIDKNFIDAGVLSSVGGISPAIIPTAGDGPWGWGINPHRSIDPIWGMQSVMRVDF
jgi:hypothetical protein